jgi:putative mRNA 3-end processing factor
MPSREALLEMTPHGLYCPRGDFYVDPWRPVDRAVITHAHADHARGGSRHYLASAASGAILRHRLGQETSLQLLDYAEPLNLNGVTVSLHPAGHILGSAQVRIEAGGQVWVVSGDYKTEGDATCTAFEPLACDTFVTESTFGLPVFNWQPQQTVLAAVNHWWQTNRYQGRTSLLFAYALGKAQRVLAGLDTAIGPIFTHGAVEAINACYRQQGIALPDTRPVSSVDDPRRFEGAMVIAPPSANTGAWTKRFKQVSRAFASGWMSIRGHRRRRSVDRGFVLSDHCDWPDLNRAIAETGAETVWVTHGYAPELVRWLTEQGRDAQVVDTRFGGDSNDQGIV